MPVALVMASYLLDVGVTPCHKTRGSNEIEAQLSPNKAPLRGHHNSINPENTPISQAIGLFMFASLVLDGR